MIFAGNKDKPCGLGRELEQTLEELKRSSDFEDVCYVLGPLCMRVAQPFIFDCSVQTSFYSMCNVLFLLRNVLFVRLGDVILAQRR